MSIEDTIRQIVREEISILKEELVSVLKLNQRNTAEELPYLLTIEESSKFMRVSKSVMYELSNHNDFPAIREGRRILIPRDKLFEWIEKQSTTKKYLDNGRGMGIKNKDYFMK